MGLDSNLKHVLENILTSDKKKTLSNPIIIEGSSVSEIELKHIYKKNKKSWKISDDFGNEYTISSLPKNIQNQIYLNFIKENKSINISIL